MIPVVMCVDDDDMVQVLSEIMLNDTQFCSKIIQLQDGKFACDYFVEQMAKPAAEREMPQLIFLDINMPVMDGWEFLDVFANDYQSLHQQIKIIVLSSSVYPLDEAKANNHPLVLSFVPKPLTIEYLETLKNHPAVANYFH